MSKAVERERNRADHRAGRIWAYVGSLFGAAVSIGCNVGHAASIGSGWFMIVSVAWPLILIVSVEVAVRNPIHPIFRFGGLGTVALCAFATSFYHMFMLLIGWAEPYPIAASAALSVDTVMLLSAAALYSTRHGSLSVDTVKPAGPVAAAVPPAERPGTDEPDPTDQEVAPSLVGLATGSDPLVRWLCRLGVDVLSEKDRVAAAREFGVSEATVKRRWSQIKRASAQAVIDAEAVNVQPE